MAREILTWVQLGGGTVTSGCWRALIVSRGAYQLLCTMLWGSNLGWSRFLPVILDCGAIVVRNLYLFSYTCCFDGQQVWEAIV